MYTAATGMLASQTAQDAIAQNLANANTTGYKQDIPEFESFGQTLLRQSNGSVPGGSLGSLGSGTTLRQLATDFSDGPLQKTDNPFDVALTGDAYLAVRTPQGVRLTRDGALTRSAQGLLVQANGGAAVLGQNGQPISIPATAKNIVIGTNGQITADGASLGKIRLASITAASGAVKVGDSEFAESAAPAASSTATIRQGYLESSNVSVVKEMVNMISVMRAYETDQKMVQAEDDATGKAVNDVGKI